MEHSWGQRVIRFYDLDGHLIEVGESMAMVIRRFFRGGAYHGANFCQDGRFCKRFGKAAA